MTDHEMRTGHPDPDLLARYAEGGADPADMAAVEAHLAVCAECRDEVAWIRSLRSQADELPRSIEPPRDLFPEIRERIAANPPVAPPAAHNRAGPRWSRGWLAAAAVLLVALSSALTLQLTRPGGGDPPEVVAGAEEEAPGLPSPADPEPGPGRFASSGEEAAGAIESAWAPTLRELEQALLEGREELQPETLEVIEANLRIIDQAIHEAREALAADPASQGAARSLNDMLETRAQVLRQVTLLTGA